MYAIMGITGQVGGQVAEALLMAGLPVRALVRSLERGKPWQERGCEIALLPDASDAHALSETLAGTVGAFLMNPPNYDPEPGFPDSHRLAGAFAAAAKRARPERIVFLSTVGAQVQRFNLLNNGGIVERALRTTGLPVALLRPAWFLENAAWGAEAAGKGLIESYLQPADRAIDMVSVRDIGEVAAKLLQEDWAGTRIIELAGPARVSPLDIAAAFGRKYGHSVDVQLVSRGDWEVRFRAEGMRHPEARIQMLDGFNHGWIEFERGAAEQRMGSMTLEEVVHQLVLKSRN